MSTEATAMTDETQKTENIANCFHISKNEQLGYLQWHDWAGQKLKKGAKQKQCPTCGKWFFREEF